MRNFVKKTGFIIIALSVVGLTSLHITYAASDTNNTKSESNTIVTEVYNQIAITLSKIITILKFEGQVLGASTNTGSSTVIFDAVRDLAPSATNTTALPIFHNVTNRLNVDGGAALGCTFDYDKSNAAITLIDPTDVNRAARQDGWSITEWNKFYSLCEAGIARTNSNRAKLFNLENGALLRDVMFFEDRIRLTYNSQDLFKEIFGNEFYPGPKGGQDPDMPFPLNLYLSNNFGFTRLTDYDQLNLSLSATLVQADIKTEDVPGTPPSGMNNSYTPRHNATRARFVFPLQWRPQGCANVRDTQEKCSEYGRYVHVSTHIFNESISDYAEHGSTNFDANSEAFVYRVNVSRYMEGNPDYASNPFMKLSQSGQANIDLKELMSEVIFDLEQKSLAENEPGKYLPARLTVNGRPESDESYLANFGIKSLNFGYEITSPSVISYNITDFKLLGQNLPPAQAAPATREALVEHMYQCINGRDPGKVAMINWLAALDGRTQQGVFSTFFVSKDYRSKNTSDALFVDDVYRCAMFRIATDTEKSASLQRLSQGVSRVDFLIETLNSAEYVNGIGRQIFLNTNVPIK